MNSPSHFPRPLSTRLSCFNYHPPPATSQPLPMPSLPRWAPSSLLPLPHLFSLPLSYQICSGLIPICLFFAINLATVRSNTKGFGTGLGRGRVSFWDPTRLSSLPAPSLLVPNPSMTSTHHLRLINFNLARENTHLQFTNTSIIHQRDELTQVGLFSTSLLAGLTPDFARRLTPCFEK